MPLVIILDEDPHWVYIREGPSNYIELRLDKEYGYVDLNELEKFKGALGLGIERDKFFTPKTLEECKNL